MTFTMKKSGTGWPWAKRVVNSAAMQARIEVELEIGLKAVSAYVADMIKRNIIQKGRLGGRQFDPIAEITKQKKKNQSNRERILIDTGDMINDLGSYRAGKLKYLAGFRSQKQAEKAAFHEGGGMTVIEGRTVFVPARPFMQPIAEHSTVRSAVKNLMISHVGNVVMRIGKI